MLLKASKNALVHWSHPLGCRVRFPERLEESWGLLLGHKLLLQMEHVLLLDLLILCLFILHQKEKGHLLCEAETCTDNFLVVQAP